MQLVRSKSCPSTSAAGGAATVGAAARGVRCEASLKRSRGVVTTASAASAAGAAPMLTGGGGIQPCRLGALSICHRLCHDFSVRAWPFCPLADLPVAPHPRATERQLGHSHTRGEIFGETAPSFSQAPPNWTRAGRRPLVDEHSHGARSAAKLRVHEAPPEPRAAPLHRKPSSPWVSSVSAPSPRLTARRQERLPRQRHHRRSLRQALPRRSTRTRRRPTSRRASGATKRAPKQRARSQRPRVTTHSSSAYHASLPSEMVRLRSGEASGLATDVRCATACPSTSRRGQSVRAREIRAIRCATVVQTGGGGDRKLGPRV